MFNFDIYTQPQLSHDLQKLLALAPVIMKLNWYYGVMD